MRIAIFGRPGSGKSTFSVNLGSKLNIPVFHLDKYFFSANWQEYPYDDFLGDLNKIITSKDWIIDGNSLKSLGLRYMRADIVIYFYLPMHICLYRVLKRFFYRDSRIEDRAEGCKSKIDFKLIRYMWNFDFHAKTRGELNNLRAMYPNVHFYKIQDDDEAQKLTDKIYALTTL